MRKKLGLSLMLSAVLGLPTASDATWPDGPTQGNGTVQAIACATSAADPGDCTSVTVVNTAAEMDTCAQLAGDHVCYVNHLLTVTDPSDTAAFDWIIDATASIDLAVVCAPGAGFVLNQTNAATSKNIVEANLVAAAANNNMRFTISGCTVYQTVNGVPGGGAGSVEGMVFKVTGDTTQRQRVIFTKNRLDVFSTGASTIGMGLNPTFKTDFFADSNIIFSAIGLDLKNQSSDADDIGMLISNNRIFANSAGSTPRCAKVDEDANIQWVNNLCSGGIIAFDTSTTNADGGDFNFMGNGNVFSDMAGRQSILEFGGTNGQETSFRNVTGAFTVMDGPISQLLIMTQSTARRINLDVTFARCPMGVTGTQMTEYLDLRSTNISASSELDYLRLNVKIPETCTLTLTSISNGTPAADADVMEAEIDVANTTGILKVSNGLTAAVDLFDGTTTFIEFTLASDAPFNPQVLCSPSGSAVIIDPDSPDATSFDTGQEAAAYCGYRCRDTQTAAGVSTTCTADLSGLGQHIVFMQ